MGVAWTTLAPRMALEIIWSSPKICETCATMVVAATWLAASFWSRFLILNESDYIRAPGGIGNRNTVRGEYYDLEGGQGRRLLMELSSGAPLSRISYLQEAPGGFYDEHTQRQRRGQGAFSLMVMDAYG